MKTAKYSIDFKITTVILLFFSHLLSIPAIQAQEFKFTSKRKQQTISFESIKNLIIVPIYINDEGPFNFILDTGVNPLLITDPTLKESLKAVYSRNIKISGYGNFEKVDAVLTSTKVKIGKAVGENIPTVFLNEDILNLSSFVGKKISGLIGYHFFNSFTVKVNYSNNILKFITPNEKTKLKGEKISFKLIDNKPYVSINIKQDGIGEQQLNVLLDCGAGHAISLETLNNSPFPIPKIAIEANLGTSLTTQIKGKAARVQELKIGSFLFKDVVAAYPRYNLDSVENKGRNANLGAELLGRFNTIYDYRNRCLYLKKNGKFRLPFEHDMSGIDFIRIPGEGGQTTINSLEKDSPAMNAGLKEGDEILTLNFKKINSFTLDEISDILQKKDGNAVIIEVYRSNEYLIKILRLKKRI